MNHPIVASPETKMMKPMNCHQDRHRAVRGGGKGVGQDREDEEALDVPLVNTHLLREHVGLSVFAMFLGVARRGSAVRRVFGAAKHTAVETSQCEAVGPDASVSHIVVCCFFVRVWVKVVVDVADRILGAPSPLLQAKDSSPLFFSLPTWGQATAVAALTMCPSPPSLIS